MRVEVLPFSILALSPVCQVPAEGFNPLFAEVDVAEFQAAMARLGPNLVVPVPKNLCPQAELNLKFEAVQDFRPDGIIKNNAYLSRIKDAAGVASQTLSAGRDPREAAEAIKHQYPDLPLDLSAAAAASDAPSAESNHQIDDILSMVATSESSSRAGSARAQKDIMGQFDELMRGLLEAVFADPRFRTMEAAWRGVQTIVKQGPVKEGQGVRVRLAPVSRDGLDATLDRLASELADDPPNLVLIDLTFDNTARGIEQLNRIAEFAETLLAPTVTAIGPAFFHLDGWAGLKKIPYLKHHLEDAAFAKWRNLAETDGANWLTVALNRFAVRAPYGPENRPKGVDFEESEPLWVNPVWALGTLIAQSHLNYGWPSRFTDYVNCAIGDLPVGDWGVDGPSVTEMSPSDDRLLEFIEAGLTPLLGPIRKDAAIVPKETTLAGGSLKFQLFFSRVLQFLFWAHDNLAGEFAQVSPAADLTAAFQAYWEKTGHPAPQDLEITAGPETDDGDVPLTIALTPPKSILPGGQRLEFGFTW